MAYWLLEPFGDEWLRTASVLSLMANQSRDQQRKPEPFEPKDFMPKIEEKEQGGGWLDTKRRFMALVRKS